MDPQNPPTFFIIYAGMESREVPLSDPRVYSVKHSECQALTKECVGFGNGMRKL